MDWAFIPLGEAFDGSMPPSLHHGTNSLPQPGLIESTASPAAHWIAETKHADDGIRRQVECCFRCRNPETRTIQTGSTTGTQLREQLDGEHGKGEDEDDDGEGHKSGFFVFIHPIFPDFLGRGFEFGCLGNGLGWRARRAHRLSLTHFNRGGWQWFGSTGLQRSGGSSDWCRASAARGLGKRNRFCPNRGGGSGRGGSDGSTRRTCNARRGHGASRTERVRSFCERNGLGSRRRWRGRWSTGCGGAWRRRSRRRHSTTRSRRSAWTRGSGRSRRSIGRGGDRGHTDRSRGGAANGNGSSAVDGLSRSGRNHRSGSRNGDDGSSGGTTGGDRGGGSFRSNGSGVIRRRPQADADRLLFQGNRRGRHRRFGWDWITHGERNTFKKFRV